MNIVITGASSGIGKAIAEKFLNSRPDAALWLIARRSDRLEALQNQYKDRNIKISIVDVRQQNEVNDWAAQVQAAWGKVDVLVNNAGLAVGVQKFQDGMVEDWETMIDTNIKGLLYVSKAFIPLLKASEQAQIINIGSTAGKMVYENGNVYCATKFAVDAIGQTLRIDLLQHQIKVTNINPGMVQTEFSLVRLKGNQAAADKVYDGYQVLSGADVADAVYYCCQLPKHVCINDLTITCTQQANSVYKMPFSE